MLIKLDEKCPDVTVRRKSNKNWEYHVRVNGDLIEPYDDGDCNWSRKIYISRRHRVVIKIDDDYYAQSRNEVVFWTEHVNGEDKRYFAPVLGWGTTSLKTRVDEKIDGEWVENLYTKKVFYCVQQYIWGAKDVSDFNGDFDSRRNIRNQTREAEEIAVYGYNMSDFSLRQGKLDSRNRFKLHDYGLFRSEDSYSSTPLKSKSIPATAEAALKMMRQTGKGEKVAV